MDPYVYPNTSVLINKLGITDEQQLITVEAQLIIANLLEIESLISKVDFDSYHSLQQIHRHLFNELYEWAGDFRSINIYKNERILGGISVIYIDSLQIQTDLASIFDWKQEITWTHQNIRLPIYFAKLMTDLWRVHPFREGNTRTVSVFMKLFAQHHNLPFNAELLSNNASYLRNALVMAAINEAPDPTYLHKIINDALSIDFSASLSDSGTFSEKYRTIGSYNVSSYEEKPFSTDHDES